MSTVASTLRVRILTTQMDRSRFQYRLQFRGITTDRDGNEMRDPSNDWLVGWLVLAFEGYYGISDTGTTICMYVYLLHIKRVLPVIIFLF